MKSPLPHFKLYFVAGYSQRAISNFTIILLDISTVPILCWTVLVTFWHSSAFLFCLSAILFMWKDHHLLVKENSRLALWTRQEKGVVSPSGITQCWWVASRSVGHWGRARLGFAWACSQDQAGWHHTVVQANTLGSVMSKYTLMVSEGNTAPQPLVCFTTELSYTKDFVSSALTGSSGIYKSSAPGRLWLHAGTYLPLFSLEKRSIIW